MLVVFKAAETVEVDGTTQVYNARTTWKTIFPGASGRVIVHAARFGGASRPEGNYESRTR